MRSIGSARRRDSRGLQRAGTADRTLCIKGRKMNELTVVDKAMEWRGMKSLVLDSVSSPITKRVYNMALDEFFDWYRLEPWPGFSKATVNAWRVTLDERALGSSSIIVRMSAIRKLAVEATDNGLLGPELAALLIYIQKGVRQNAAILGTSHGPRPRRPPAVQSQ